MYLYEKTHSEASLNEWKIFYDWKMNSFVLLCMLEIEETIIEFNQNGIKLFL